MMLHRHFDGERNENMTTLADVTPHTEFVSSVFPPDKETVEAPKKRSRKKTDTDE